MFFFPCLSPSESSATQAAESASPGAPHGLQGERDDRWDDAEAGGACPKETPAGRQEGRGEQEPDDRETDENQQGQDQKHEGEEVQAEPVPHGSVQRFCPGNGHLLPSRGPRSYPGTSLPSSSSPIELWSERVHKPQEVLVLKDRSCSLQPRVLQEEPHARAEHSVNPRQLSLCHPGMWRWRVFMLVYLR